MRSTVYLKQVLEIAHSCTFVWIVRGTTKPFSIYINWTENYSATSALEQHIKKEGVGMKLVILQSFLATGLSPNFASNLLFPMV